MDLIYAILKPFSKIYIYIYAILFLHILTNDIYAYFVAYMYLFIIFKKLRFIGFNAHK